jgi:hypothetical protein
MLREKCRGKEVERNGKKGVFYLRVKEAEVGGSVSLSLSCTTRNLMPGILTSSSEMHGPGVKGLLVYSQRDTSRRTPTRGKPAGQAVSGSIAPGSGEFVL